MPDPPFETLNFAYLDKISANFRTIWHFKCGFTRQGQLNTSWKCTQTPAPGALVHRYAWSPPTPEKLRKNVKAQDNLILFTNISQIEKQYCRNIYIRTVRPCYCVALVHMYIPYWLLRAEIKRCSQKYLTTHFTSEPL